MVLMLSRPTRHPKTGVYYFRKVVPHGLRSLVGKREEKISLRTKDPSEARRLHAEEASRVDKKWEALRKGPTPLSQKQVAALTGEWYRALIAEHEENPGEPDAWDAYAEALIEGLELLDQRSDGIDEPPFNPDEGYRRLHSVIAIDRFLLERGLVVTDATRNELVVQFARAHVQASSLLTDRALGDYRPDRNADRFPAWEPSKTKAKVSNPPPSGVTLSGLLKDWWHEAQALGRKPSTYVSYSTAFEKFRTLLKHDDAGQVTKADVVRFKDARLAEINPRTGKPIGARTVKNVDLVALKSVLGWAVNNGRLSTNPATGVTLKLGQERRERSKEFTPEEIKALLGQALGTVRGAERPKLTAAYRWVPWLLAYTGARAGEIVQLRKQDVRLEGNRWVLRITPEAGTVKTNQFRDVVLHEHLIQQGFADFVRGSKAGHLFVSPESPSAEHVENKVNATTNRLRERAREVMTDERVSPLHGWRHTFKTIGRNSGIDFGALDAIQGHAPANIGASYGGVEVAALAHAIDKFPRYSV